MTGRTLRNPHTSKEGRVLETCTRNETDLTRRGYKKKRIKVIRKSRVEFMVKESFGKGLGRSDLVPGVTVRE